MTTGEPYPSKEDDGWDSLLGEAQQAQAEAEVIEQVRAELVVYLAGKGLTFDPDIFGVVTADTALYPEAATGSDPSDNASSMWADTQEMLLDTYTEALTIFRGASELRNFTAEEQTEFKKHLQASSLISGDIPIWRQLIDDKFPGDALTDDDTEIIAEEMTKVSAENQEVAIFDALRADILEAVRRLELNVSEDGVDVDKLATILTVLAYRARDGINLSTITEGARIEIMKSGIPFDRWDEIINRFFNQ
jgi:hypothetical protein